LQSNVKGWQNMNSKDRKELRRQYEEQKQIEKYQKERILSVPKTNKAMLAEWIIVFLFLITLDVAFSIILIRPLWLRISTMVVLLVVIFETYGRFFGIKIVECYQHYATEKTRRRCLCVPSCSEYAILCFKKFGLVKALLKIRKRLYITCQGPDYKIDWP